MKSHKSFIENEKLGMEKILSKRQPISYEKAKEQILRLNGQKITSCSCAHLIINKTKTIRQGNEVQETSFHCKLKRESREIAVEINQAFHKKTQISVAGYTCYYQNHNVVRCNDCPKYQKL